MLTAAYKFELMQKILILPML